MKKERQERQRRLRASKRNKKREERRRKWKFKTPKKPKKRKEFELPHADPDSGKHTCGVTTYHPHANRYNPYHRPSPALMRLLANSDTK